MEIVLNFLLNYITLAVAGVAFVIILVVLFAKRKTIFYKGIMPSEKVLDLPVDCNTLAGSVNL